MRSAREFFIHGLSDMLDAERNLVEVLDIQAKESSRSDLGKAFESHRAQTQKQAERIQQVFAELGEKPEETECKGIAGLKGEHDDFAENEPTEDLLDIFNVEAATKVESYEICSYESLIRLAEQLGLKKGMRLLQQNLKEEQQTLKKMQGFSEKLRPVLLDERGEETAEEEPSRRRAA